MKTPEQLKGSVRNMAAKKRNSVKDIEEWQEIIADIKAEPLMQKLWDNYVTENQYIGELSFEEVLKTVEEVALMIRI